MGLGSVIVGEGGVAGSWECGGRGGRHRVGEWGRGGRCGVAWVRCMPETCTHVYAFLGHRRTNLGSDLFWSSCILGILICPVTYEGEEKSAKSMKSAVFLHARFLEALFVFSLNN